MSLKKRLEKLERPHEQPVDIAASLKAARDRCALGIPHPRSPSDPEWEHSRDPIKRALFAARRRVGLG
jgi:hypothetical protein